jgi:hypothetical protein
MASSPVHDQTPQLTIEKSSIRPVRWLEEVVGKPWFGTWIAFMALFAGCIASIFTDDIKASVPFQWPGRNFPWPGRVDWVQQRVASKTIALLQRQAREIAGRVVEVSTNVTTIGTDTRAIGNATETIHTNVLSTQKSAADLSDASQKVLKRIEHVDGAIKTVQSSAAKLQEIVETMPLGTFVGEFGRLTAIAEDLLTRDIAKQPKVSADQLAILIRDLLSIVATLAESYDGRSNVRYAANIMIYVPSDQKPPYLSTNALDLLKFWPKTDAALEALAGVLILKRDFASFAHAFESGHAVDEELEELAFAIPKETKNNQTGKWRVLPGAPRVFVGGGVTSSSERLRTHLIDDIRNFDFQATLDIDESCAEELKHYYRDGGPGDAARSCQTFPLPDSGGNVRAVLNIHCSDSPWLARSGDRQRNFTMLILPLVAQTGNVLELLSRAT